MARTIALNLPEAVLARIRLTKSRKVVDGEEQRGGSDCSYAGNGVFSSGIQRLCRSTRCWSHGDSAWSSEPTLAANAGIDKDFGTIITAIKIIKAPVEDHEQVAQLLVGSLAGIELVNDVRRLVYLRIGQVEARIVQPCTKVDPATWIGQRH